MTTLNVHLPQPHLPGLTNARPILPGAQALKNFLVEAGQVLSGALLIIPAPAASLNRDVRRDLGLRDTL